jgi:hypothetical protein
MQRKQRDPEQFAKHTFVVDVQAHPGLAGYLEELPWGAKSAEVVRLLEVGLGARIARATPSVTRARAGSARREASGIGSGAQEVDYRSRRDHRQPAETIPEVAPHAATASDRQPNEPALELLRSFLPRTDFS